MDNNEKLNRIINRSRGREGPTDKTEKRERVKIKRERREGERERERERERDRDGQKERQRNNRILYKDRRISISRIFIHRSEMLCKDELVSEEPIQLLRSGRQ